MTGIIQQTKNRHPAQHSVTRALRCTFYRLGLRSRIGWFLVCALLAWPGGLPAQDDVIPHGQSEPPNPAYTPEEAIERMTVPEGFTVELVVGEPDLVNPVAMTFDEKGRIWVAESLEYPRLSAGAGRDRIKVLEDTDHDGQIDKVTIFADGLNIPCGIAVGHGGVWVSNSPDILFLQDTDGDLKADHTEVVVTGFGRHDTHELPNSLVWGPDGYLYGLNGVFNYSHVKQGDQEWQFTCAMFRIHPRTREFELFAEGTSNPWGITWDSEGNAFLSACVIDHLWHLTETGYYHRQAGPYPPYTWKIESIVDHRHQKAAYCGIEYFDSDAYPPEYRDRLVMGNIHGNCINVDALSRDGSTYRGTGEPDLLSANDAWFMPVAQKTGPDGCLYILDWYDRYHCYQDARRDPEGIDRLHGRIYRLRYEDTPRAGAFDLATETNEQLIERLHSPNIFFRATAQRVLSERNDSASQALLEAVVLAEDKPYKPRMHALWALISRGDLDPEFHLQLINSGDARLRTWAVRAAGNQHEVSDAIRGAIPSLVSDASPDVRLQVAIAARKVDGLEALPLLLDVLANSSDDPLIPRIVWQNLHPLLEGQHRNFVTLVTEEYAESAAMELILSRSVDRILAVRDLDPAVITELVVHLIEAGPSHQNAAMQCMSVLATRVQSGEFRGDSLDAIRKSIDAPVLATLDGDNADLASAAAFLAASWGFEPAVERARLILLDGGQSDETRLSAVHALIAGESDQLVVDLQTILSSPDTNSVSFRGQLVSSLGRLDDPDLAPVILDLYNDMEPELQPKAIELLTGRLDWSFELVARIASDAVPANAVNVNQVRKMLARDNEDLNNAVAKHWGTIRTDRNPDRERIIGEMRERLYGADGDPYRGIAVFEKVCGQCHKIHGSGFDVGPDITSNGRGDFDQLLSNVFDPSLVIGADYQARTVVTVDGRVETGLLLEENDQRIVLRPQGSEQIVIASDDIEEISVSKLSLMPEDLEDQITPQEMVDLFAFLTLDRHPDDEQAKPIPGSRPSSQE